VKKKPLKKPALPTASVIAADDSVRSEWLRRVEAEYRSGAHAQHLTLWLMQLGAPPDLLEMGLGVVGDELKHAELCAAVYREAGGSGAPQLARETLVLARHPSEPLEHDVLRVGVEMFCLGETVAVRLFSRLRESATVPVACRALERILRDEVSHRDFGWALLEWLLSTPLETAYRAQLQRELPSMLTRVRASYGGNVAQRIGADALEQAARTTSDATRAWGLMPVAEYIRVVDETFARDYTPRFAELAIAL
jgi:hypothetical protein